MFNLIVSGSEDAWDGRPYELLRNRVFEYTDEAISARFKELTPDQLARLYDLPTLFAYERNWEKHASVGKVTRVRIRQRNVQIEYAFRRDIPEIPQRILEELKRALDIEDFEFYRTHWAIKDVDLLAALAEGGIDVGPADKAADENPAANLPRAVSIPVHPKVFRVPDDPVDPRLVAVMAPFDAAFDRMFEAVERAATEAGLRSLCSRQIWEAEEIIQDIFSLIYRSRMVVCDFSGQNANVFYEAGIAHTMGKVVIPIAQSVADLPFDIRHHRALIYSNDDEGLELLVAEIGRRMRKVAAAAL